LIGAHEKQGDRRSLFDEEEEEEEEETAYGKRVSLSVELGNERGGVTKWIWWMLFLVAVPSSSPDAFSLDSSYEMRA
jgi:hypothetical protein